MKNVGFYEEQFGLLKHTQCPSRWVFNPNAVRFRYRHHECRRTRGHEGLHECVCGVDFDELGPMFLNGIPCRSSDFGRLSVSNIKVTHGSR